MPHYNIWIRAEDDEKWQALENRSEWLHKHLSGAKVGPKPKEDNSGSVGSRDDSPKQTQAKENPPLAVIQDRFGTGFCKIHGTPLDARGRCLQFGCKFN